LFIALKNNLSQSDLLYWITRSYLTPNITILTQPNRLVLNLPTPDKWKADR